MAISSNAKTSKGIGRALGYSDDDLTTPGHDALVLWVRDHWLELVSRFFKPQFLAARIANAKRFETSEAARFARETELHAQYPSGRNPTPLHLAPEPEALFSWFPVEIEKRVPGGWIDVYGAGIAQIEIEVLRDLGEEVPVWVGPRWELAVEVKTNIRSFGELLRQLRIYREFIGKAGPQLPYRHVCVVSPDTRFAADIEQQGFLFHEPNTGEQTT
jgi:hypothetical protein